MNSRILKQYKALRQGRGKDIETGNASDNHSGNSSPEAVCLTFSVLVKIFVIAICIQEK